MQLDFRPVALRLVTGSLAAAVQTPFIAAGSSFALAQSAGATGALAAGNFASLVLMGLVLGRLGRLGGGAIAGNELSRQLTVRRFARELRVHEANLRRVVMQIHACVR